MPSALVLVVHSVPRSRSLAVTKAFGIAEPDGSVTRPVMPALISCDTKGVAKRATAHRSNKVLIIAKTPWAGISILAFRTESVYTQPSPLEPPSGMFTHRTERLR